MLLDIQTFGDMTVKISERDWKYMVKIKDGLLADLCERINRQSMAILKESGISEYKKYLELYKHIEKSEYVVAQCFDDWRRSTLLVKIMTLRHHDLLGEEHLAQLSPEFRHVLKAWEG